MTFAHPGGGGSVGDGGLADHPAMGPAVVRGGALLLLRHAVAFAVTFAGSAILARALGAAILGVYFAALSYFLVARQLIDFSVPTHVIRSHGPPAHSTLAGCFWLQQVLGVAVLGVTLLAAWWGLHVSLFPDHAPLLGWLLIAAAAGAYFQSWQSIPAARLERSLAYGKVGAIEMSEAVAFNAAALLLLLAGAGAWSLVIALVLRGLVPAAVAYSLLPFRPGARPSFAVPSRLRAELASLTAAQGVVWAVTLAPVVIIGGLAGPRQLALAQLGYALLGSVGTLAAIGQRLALPALARLQSDHLAFGKLVSRSLSALSLTFIPLVFAVGSLAPVWVPAVYGPEWAPMAWVLFLGALPVSLTALLGVFHSAVVARGLAGLVLKQNVLHLLIFCSVLLMASGRAGAIALPLAHLAAVPAGVLFLRAYRRTTGRLDARHALLTGAAAAAVAFAAWRLASAGAALSGVALWVVFAAAAIWFSWRVVQPARLLRWLVRPTVTGSS